MGWRALSGGRTSQRCAEETPVAQRHGVRWATQPLRLPSPQRPHATTLPPRGHGEGRAAVSAGHEPEMQGGAERRARGQAAPPGPTPDSRGPGQALLPPRQHLTSKLPNSRAPASHTCELKNPQSRRRHLKPMWAKRELSMLRRERDAIRARTG